MKKKFIKTVSIALAAGLAAASLTGCSGGKINGKETAIVVNGEEISLGEVNFLLRYQQAQSYYYMSMLGMSSDTGVWSMIMDEETGETYGDTLKESEFNTIVKMVVARQKAINEYGVTLTEEEENAISEAVAAFMEANPEAGDTFGADEEQIRDMLRLYTYSHDIQPYITTDVDREVSDEEAAKSRIIYARVGKVDDGEEGAEAANEQYIEDMKTLLSQAKEQPELDSEGVNTLAKEINEDFFAMNYTFSADDTTLGEEVMAALSTLPDGTWCDDVIETEKYYYIVKMVNVFDEEATESEKKSIIAGRENEVVQACFNEWAEEAEVEKKACWDKLVISDDEIYSLATS